MLEPKLVNLYMVCTFFSGYQATVKPQVLIRTSDPSDLGADCLAVAVTHRDTLTGARGGAHQSVCSLFRYKSLYQKLKTDHLLY